MPAYTPPRYLKRADLDSIIASLALKEVRASKGVAGGYASLGTDGLVPLEQLPPIAATSEVSVTQAGHGLTAGNVIRFDGSIYRKARADSADNAETVGVVKSVSGNSFVFVLPGDRLGIFSGLTPGEVYFLSPTTAGAVTLTEPTAVGEVSKPVLLALSATSAAVLTYRGVVIPAAATPDPVRVPEAIFSGIQNGVNHVFTMPDDYLAGTVEVHANGARLSARYGHFSETAGRTVTIADAPPADYDLIFSYNK